MINQFIQQAYEDSFCPQIKASSIQLNKPQTSTLFHIDCKYTKKKVCTCSNFSIMPLNQQKNQRVLQCFLQHELEGVTNKDFQEAYQLNQFYENKIMYTQEVEKNQ